MSRVAVYRNDRELRNYRKKIRRQRQVRRNIVMSVLTALVLVVLALSFYGFTSMAKEDTESVSYKYFTSIQVEEGDSLWSIAEEYLDEEHYDSAKEYIIEVMTINKLSDDVIFSGQYLVIPYYSYAFVQ